MSMYAKIRRMRFREKEPISQIGEKGTGKRGTEGIKSGPVRPSRGVGAPWPHAGGASPCLFDHRLELGVTRCSLLLQV